MKPKHQRLVLICSALCGLGFAAFLTVTAFKDSLVFFYTPSEISSKQVHPQQRIRLGGLVKPGSLNQKGELVHFTIADNTQTVDVTYQGLLPDLFKEGQGVVAEGYLVHPTSFQADSVLAKHDETYMPKEVADRLGCKDAQ